MKKLLKKLRQNRLEKKRKYWKNKCDAFASKHRIGATLASDPNTWDWKQWRGVYRTFKNMISSSNKIARDIQKNPEKYEAEAIAFD